jgi:hypothetical protein
MKLIRNILAVCSITLFAALALSCNEGTNTLFDNIINDTPIRNNNQLGNTANVPAMTKIVTTYYAAVGKIRFRADSATIWDSLTLATGIHYTLATDGANLYCGVFDGPDGSATGHLYQYNPGTAETTVVNIAGLKSIVKVKNFGSNVYASYKKTDNTYSLWSITTGLELPGLGALNLTAPIVDFVFDGVNVLFVCGTSVYMGSTMGSTAFDNLPSNPYAGITYDTTLNRIMVSTLNGLIFQSDDAVGSNWTSYGPYTYMRNSTSTNAPFGEFIMVSANYFLVGTSGAGFWYIDTSSTWAADRWNGTAQAELYNGAINSFYVDATRVFFCTIGAGLWDNTYAAGAWGGTWTRE